MRSFGPTPRLALVVVLLGVAALVLPVAAVLVAVVAVAGLTVWDARTARSSPVVHRTVPPRVTRGSTVRLTVAAEWTAAARVGRLVLR